MLDFRILVYIVKMETAKITVPTYFVQHISGWVPFSIPNSSFTLNALTVVLNSSWFGLRQNDIHIFLNAIKWLNLLELSPDIHCGKPKIKQNLKTKLSPQLCVFLTAKTLAQDL